MENSKSKGFVTVRSFDAEDKCIDVQCFRNTVLKVGRRALIAALGGNLLTDGFNAYVTHMAIGTGGLDGFGNKIPVPDTQTGFLGGASNVKGLVEVQSSMASSDSAAVTFYAALPLESFLNSNNITQLGLVLSDGTYYAVSTWEGVLKDSSIRNSIEWTVEIL